MKRPLILVIEDNPITRQMTRVTLTTQEYRVLEAPDGCTALELAARRYPDLVLQDLKLPDMDGFELVRRLRRLPGCEALPILAVSGFVSRVEEARASGVGFADFLVKPVSPVELTRVVQRHLPVSARRGEGRGRGRLVLLVDDDPVRLTSARDRLLAEGFQVVVAHDGVEALELVRRSQPAAIVASLLVPRLDGFGLCLAIRRDPALVHIPVVLAGDAPVEFEAVCRSVGASALVARDPDFRGLMDALLTSLDAPSPDIGKAEQDFRESHIYRVILQLERLAAANAELASRSAAQAGALSLLRTIADSLSTGTDPEAALERALRQSFEAGGFSMGSLYLIGDGGRLELRARSGYRGLAVGELEDLFGHGELFRRAIETGAPIAIPSPTVPEETARDFLGRAGTVSALIVPLEFRGTHIGALIVATDLENLVREESLDFARVLGQQIAQAIVLHRAFRQVATAEERYHTLFENAAEGIFRSTAEGRLLLANPALARIVGYPTPAEMIAGVDDVRALYVDPQRRDEWIRLLAERGVVSDFECQIRRLDGRATWVSLTARAVPDAAKGVHYEGMIVDVSERKRAEAATAALAEMARAFSRSLDPDVVARLVTDGARTLLDARSTALYRLDPESSAAARFSVSGGSDGISWSAQIPPGMGLAAVVIRDGCSATSPDVARDPRMTLTPEMRVEVESGNLRARLVVPLLVQQQIKGFLAISDRTGHTFTDHDVSLAEALADHAAIALENARLYDEAEQRRQVAEVMADLTRSINASLDAGTVLQRVTDGAKNLCDSDQAVIALWDASRETMTCHCQAGTSGDHPWEAVVRGRGSGGWVLANGLPFRTSDYANDPRITKDYVEAVTDRGVVAQMVVPILSQGRIEGLLYVENRTARPFTDRDEGVLLRLADHAVAAIQNSRLFESERKARESAETSEESLRLLFANGPIPMWVTDRKTLRFLEVNDAAVAHYGYSRDEFLGMRITDIRPPEDIPHLLEAYEQSVASRRPGLQQSGPWRHRCKDGRIIEVEIAAHPLDFAAREAVFVVAQDVTERRLLETQLRQTQKMEAIGNLAGGIAHDFNNLLTVIGGRAHLMSWHLQPGDTLWADLEIIQKTTERAAALTHQLLAFSRKQILEVRVLDLNGIVSGTEKMLQRLIGEHIELQTRLDPALRRVTADPSQLEQIILNLAVNSRDAMPDGGKLLIETKNVELEEEYCRTHAGVTAGSHVMLAVSDTGRGMDAATQSRVFEPFFTTKGPGQGTGLGLSTVYGIVKQTGGHISVYSEARHGTRFSIYFPSVDAPADPHVAVPAGVPPPRGVETVLLAEDEDGVRQVARETLEQSGYAVLEARDPEEALRLAREHPGPLDLLLTDVVMPRMSGKALADQLAAQREGIKVLYTSGYTADAIGHHGVLEEGIFFLQKPYTPATLARKVREVLDHPG